MSATPVHLARNLAHDLRASLHGLSLALEMAREGLSSDSDAKTIRYLGLAAGEAAHLDCIIERWGLWLRTLHQDYRVQAQRVDLRQILQERLAICPALAVQPPAFQVEIPDGPVMVASDVQLLSSSIDGLLDFMQAFAVAEEPASIQLESAGRLIISGPGVWRPTFQSCVQNQIDGLQTLIGPVKWLIGLSLAVNTCRAYGGEVNTVQSGNRCSLCFAWLRAA